MSTVRRINKVTDVFVVRISWPISLWQLEFQILSNTEPPLSHPIQVLILLYPIRWTMAGVEVVCRWNICVFILSGDKKLIMLWQIWTFWRSDRHSEEIPLRHTLLQPSWSDALSATTWAVYISSHSAAGRQVLSHFISFQYYAVSAVHCIE